MGEIVIKLPDIGEGIAEAEISEWAVELGQWIKEDDTIGVVLTDKAAVEIPSGHTGKVTWLAGAPGDMLAVGGALIKLDGTEDREGAGAAAPKQEAPPLTQTMGPPTALSPTALGPTADTEKTLAAPAVRQRARDLGLTLAQVQGTGPEGRVTHRDLDQVLADGKPTRPMSHRPGEAVVETKVIGLRRKIAEAMARSHARIPQITIIEEVDVTELERLRSQMMAQPPDGAAKLTLLPFVAQGIIRALAVAPQINGRYDDDAGVLKTHEAVHLGVATQTEKGLVVPVLEHAQRQDIWGMAADIARLSSAAREGSIARTELTGATISLTSLGALGAVATTPLINHPELAIVGVNRKQTRPLWDGHQFQPREVINLSASFDHRIVDGWDAAQFIARLKTVLETPALLFL